MWNFSPEADREFYEYLAKTSDVNYNAQLAFESNEDVLNSESLKQLKRFWLFFKAHYEIMKKFSFNKGSSPYPEKAAAKEAKDKLEQGLNDLTKKFNKLLKA